MNDWLCHLHGFWNFSPTYLIIVHTKVVHTTSSGGNYIRWDPKPSESISKQQWTSCKTNSDKSPMSWNSYHKADASCRNWINMMVKQKDRESVHIWILVSTARKKEYGASTIFCTATSGRPSPLNDFWYNLQVCCSFLAVRCVAPP